MREAGAEVIDLGCLPDTPFPHLEDAVAELKRAGVSVSVDSGNVEELRRGGRARAGFLLHFPGKNPGIPPRAGAAPGPVPANPRHPPSPRRAPRLPRQP